MLKTKWSTNWVEDIWVLHLGSRSTVSQASLRAWLLQKGCGKMGFGSRGIKRESP